MDYNATAPLLLQAKSAMLSAMDRLGNPSSVHQDGQAARKIVNKARDQVAHLFGSNPAHVTFTSGATEAASHLLTPHYKMGRAPLKISKLYTSKVEHPCVLNGGRFEADNVVLINVDQNGLIDMAHLEQELSSHDLAMGLPMVALQAANNETGVIQPYEEAIKLAKTYQAVTVIDTVQVMGRLSFDIEALQADFAFCSAHKMGGPKGVGAIISRGEILMPEPLITGGGHEKGHRGGTENVIGIAGFGAACARMMDQFDQFASLCESRDSLILKMREFAPDLVIHGEAIARIGNTICFSLPGMKSETLQIAFDMEGISVSSGSACSSGKVGESHVLSAMYGRSYEELNAIAGGGAIRLSMGVETNDAERAGFLEAFEKITSRRSRRAQSAPSAA